MRISAEISITDTGGIGEKRSSFKVANYVPTTAEEVKAMLEDVKAYLIFTAQNTLAEEQKRGFEKDPVTLVDRVRGKLVKDVSYLGQIDYLAKSVFLVDILEIYDHIVARSKVVTGLYAEHNFVFYNRRVIATNMAELEKWTKSSPIVKEGDVINFVNLVPYARRLERLGVRKGTTQNRRQKYSKTSRNKYGKSGRFAVPNGAYYLAYRGVRRRFKGLFNIKFDFMLGSTLGITNIPITNKRGRTLRTVGSGDSYTKGRPYLYPTIELRILSGSVK
jgi:hypothetical protein